jgi:hypothetical protein
MKRTHILLLSLTMLASAPALAQWAEFPTGNIDSRTVRNQAKVESLYERGDYKRAHFIYSNELARQGDKYAQYMTGYMYLMGQGVEENPVKASAWYRISAERRAPEFMAVRDQVLLVLNEEQRRQSDKLYVQLRKDYSDLAIMMGLLVEDLESLKTARTGSHFAGNSSSVTIIDPNTGMPVSADYIRNRDLRTAQERLDFITTRLDIDPIKADQVERQLDGLWERVYDYLGVVDDEADGLYASP